MPRPCCKRFFDRIPDDVPVFTVVAWDPTAVPTVEAWLAEARKLGVNPFKLETVTAHLNELKRWAAANPDKMKVPD
jgi:hypothetical protein